MTYPIHDHVDIFGNLSVNCTYRTAQNTAPGVMNVYVPTGESAGNGVFLQSAGSAGIDQPFLAWRNASQAVQLSIWTDMAGGSARIKSQGSLSFHTANVALNSAANERMYISPGGNVGIGVNAPEALLHLKAAGSPTVLVESTSANNPALRLRSASATGTVKTEGAQRMVIGYDAWGNLEFEVGSAGPPKLVIQPSGNVGIGTASPEAKLTVNGAGATGVSVMNHAAYGLRLEATPTSAGVGKASLKSITSGYPLVLGADQGDDIWIVPGENGGNVGIGAAPSPGARLDVAGNLKVSGQTTLNGVSYSWPAGAGTTGQLLATNGAGGLSWATVSGGGNSWTQNGESLYPANSEYRVGIGTNPLVGVKFEVRGGEAVFGSGWNTHGISLREYQNDPVIRQVLAFNSANNVVVGNPNVNGILAATGWTFKTGVGSSQDRMVIHDNGNVGVGTGFGTSGPNARLEVANDSGLGLFRLAVTTGPQSPRLSVNIVDAGGSQPSVQFQADGQTAVPHLALAPGLGNVGIGQPNPQAKLHISGSTAPNATAFQVSGPPSGQGSTAKILGDLLVEGTVFTTGNITGDKVFGAVYG